MIYEGSSGCAMQSSASEDEGIRVAGTAGSEVELDELGLTNDGRGIAKKPSDLDDDQSE